MALTQGGGANIHVQVSLQTAMMRQSSHPTSSTSVLHKMSTLRRHAIRMPVTGES